MRRENCALARCVMGDFTSSVLPFTFYVSLVSLHHTLMNTRSPVSRREFLQNTSKAVAAAAFAPAIFPSTAKAAASTKTIGIQVGAISFVDEGTEKVLDSLQEKGAVNAIFLATFTYGRGIAGR